MTMTTYQERKAADARKAFYIQFPLAILAFFKGRFKLLEAAIRYGIMHYSKRELKGWKSNPETLRDLDDW